MAATMSSFGMLGSLLSGGTAINAPAQGWGTIGSLASMATLNSASVTVYQQTWATAANTVINPIPQQWMYGTQNWNQGISYPMQTTYYATLLGSSVSYGGYEHVPVETEKQRLQREAREAELAAKEQARRARATEVLISTLTDEQRKQFEIDKRFELQVNGRLYRINPSSRVERLDPATKKVLSYFCIHPELQHGLPREDVALSQKLLLETAEPEFLRIANETKAA